MKFSIKHKISFSFALIYILMCILLVIVIYHSTNIKNEQIVRNDMTYIEKNINAYMQQFVKVNKITLSKEKIVELADKLQIDILNETQQLISIYDNKGKKINRFNLFDSNLGDNKYDNELDVRKSLDGKSICSINKYKTEYIVYLSVPIKNDNKTIGVIRFKKDYTYLYDYSHDLIKVILIVLIFIFIIIIFVTSIVSKNITYPLLNLRQASIKIASGNFKEKINISTNDEIGDLAENFEYMRIKLNEYIGKLKDDNNKLLKAENNQKEFYRRITHAFKTPLTGIIGYAQLVEMNKNNDKEFINLASKEIINKGKELDCMVQELLEISKQSERIFEKDKVLTNVSEIINNACKDILFKAKKYNIQVYRNIEENIIFSCVKDDIKTIALNILDNAIKYSNVNSSVEVILQRNNNTIIFRVNDNGKGMSKENINKIFEPFYRVDKKNRNGNGLGLTIVKRIIEKYDAQINIKSKVNQGTCVTIIFESYV